MTVSFDDLRALVVDDESLLAVELASALEDVGCRQVLISRSPDEARDLLGEDTAIDLAVLSIDALGDTVLPLAQSLRRSGVRVVLTGAQSNPERLARTLGLTVFAKPYTVSEVLESLQG